MAGILDLNARDFAAALAELQLDPQRDAELRREYRRQNSPFSPIYGLIDRVRQGDEAEGRVRSNVVPMTRPQGMTGIEAVRSGQAELALPNMLLGGAEAAPMAVDAPASAYRGGIPSQDMVGEGLNMVGLLNVGSLAATAPRGALRAGAARNVDEYAGSHRAPSREYGASLDDPREMFGGDDIYSENAMRYFGHGDTAMDRESIRAINAARGNPDAEITVYRAVPSELEGAVVNAGDWVSPSRKYAETHGEGPLGGDYQIIEERVRAGDLFTDGDIHEWGYTPAPQEQPDPLRNLRGLLAR